MTELATARLHLRPFRADDLDAVAELYSREEVVRFLGSQARDRAAAGERLARYRSLDDPVRGFWALQPIGGERLVGTVLLNTIRDSETVARPSGDVEIGWHLHPDVWGRGYAAEAAAAVLEHAFAGGLRQVVAVTHVENFASQRVARRIGMTPAGRTDRYYDVTTELFTASARTGSG